MMENWAWITFYSILWALILQGLYDGLKEILGIPSGWAVLIVGIPLIVILRWKRPKTTKNNKT